VCAPTEREGSIYYNNFGNYGVRNFHRLYDNQFQSGPWGKIKRSVKINSLNNIGTESKGILIAGQLSKKKIKTFKPLSKEKHCE